jgi:hypothetical protein
MIMNSVFILYWVARLYTQSIALLTLASVLLSASLPPDIEAPSPLAAPLWFIPGAIVGCLFLLPFRWSAQEPYFRVRLVLHLLASVWIAYLAIGGISSFGVSGPDLVISIGLLLLAMTSPMSIVLFRRLNASQSSPRPS